MSDLAETAARLERDALAQLEAVLGGSALCRVGGGALLPAKHWEGRSSALAQVRRELRRAPDGPAGHLLEAVRADWTARLGRLSGPAWESYTAGGLAVLDELTVGETR